MSTRSLNGPVIAIVVGVLTVLVHLSLAATGVMTAAQWVSGVVIGLLIAGVGNTAGSSGAGSRSTSRRPTPTEQLVAGARAT